MKTRVNGSIRTEGGSATIKGASANGDVVASAGSASPTRTIIENENRTATLIIEGLRGTLLFAESTSKIDLTPGTSLDQVRAGNSPPVTVRWPHGEKMPTLVRIGAETLVESKSRRPFWKRWSDKFTG